MPPLRPHAAFLVLLLVAAMLLFGFTAQDSIATIGDDSVAYLALARSYAGTASPALAPWVKFVSQFPPLFPLALAAAGGAESLRVAHGVVALFAVLGLGLVYVYGMLRFGRVGVALTVAVFFLLAPSAWISVKGVLSESLYLFLSFAALCVHARWLERGGRGSAGAWVGFGLLLAAGWLARMAGVALVVAYVVHAALRMRGEPRQGRVRLVLPLAVFAAVAITWLALRPVPGYDEYHAYVAGIGQSWKDNPLLMLSASGKTLWYAWIETFAADADVALPLRIILALLAILALAGAVRRALTNHLDGWYVLAAIPMVSYYVVGDNDVRRFLYPILPLLLAHATEVVLALSGRLEQARPRRILLGAAALALAGVCVPAMMLVAVKSRDTAPLVPGGHIAAADVLEYYTTLNTPRARAIAARGAAVIEGLERIGAATPPDAKVMWVRPDYVALLGGREGVPLDPRWNAHDLAAAIRATGATHVVLASVYKSTLQAVRADPVPVTRTALDYSDPVLAVANAVTGRDEFVLLKVDPARLSAHLAN